MGSFTCAFYKNRHEQPLELLAILRGRLAHAQSLVVQVIQTVDSHEWQPDGEPDCMFSSHTSTRQRFCFPIQAMILSLSLFPPHSPARPSVPPRPNFGVFASTDAASYPLCLLRNTHTQTPRHSALLPHAVLYCAVLCCAVLCCAPLGCAALCCAVLCCATLSCAAQCFAVLCCAVLCCAALCRTALRCVVPC